MLPRRTDCHRCGKRTEQSTFMNRDEGFYCLSIGPSYNSLFTMATSWSRGEQRSFRWRQLRFGNVNSNLTNRDCNLCTLFVRLCIIHGSGWCHRLGEEQLSKSVRGFYDPVFIVEGRWWLRSSSCFSREAIVSYWLTPLRWSGNSITVGSNCVDQSQRCRRLHNLQVSLFFSVFWLLFVIFEAAWFPILASLFLFFFCLLFGASWNITIFVLLTHRVHLRLSAV